MFKLKANKRLVFLVAAPLLVLFLASAIPLLRPPVFFIVKSPLKLFSLIGKELQGIFFYHKNFVQNQNLTRETDILKRRLNEARELFSENQRLKEILSFKQKSLYRVVAAAVIGRSPDNWSSLVIIDKGSLHGIRRGFVVINYLGLIGRVVEITSATSKVMLINDPSLSVSGIVQRSRQEGLVSGTLGSNLIMKYLSPDADIRVSDIVVTSGLTPAYPKGLIIGTIIDVADEFLGLSRYAVIKPAVNLSSVEEVLIIIP